MRPNALRRILSVGMDKEWKLKQNAHRSSATSIHTSLCPHVTMERETSSIVRAHQDSAQMEHGSTTFLSAAALKSQTTSAGTTQLCIHCSIAHFHQWFAAKNVSQCQR